MRDESPFSWLEKGLAFKAPGPFAFSVQLQSDNAQNCTVGPLFVDGRLTTGGNMLL